MIWPVFTVWVLKSLEGCLFLYHVVTLCHNTGYHYERHRPGHLVLYSDVGAVYKWHCKAGSESRLELHGECALSARATAAPVGMDCLVYRTILNLIPGFDSDEEFGPFCHHTPFLGDGLGLMTFAFCKLSLIFPMFARLHDDASFGPVGGRARGERARQACCGQNLYKPTDMDFV